MEGIPVNSHREGCLCVGCICSNYEIEIESLRAKVADLEATIAEQATEISKLIAAVADHVTVRAEQRQTIIDQAAEIERMKHSEAVMKAYYEQIFQDGGKRIVELRQQLAAEQAYAEQLREALEQYSCLKCGSVGWLWGDELDDASEDTRADTMTKYQCDGLTCKALALNHDTTALQEYGAKLVERVAQGNIELDEVNLMWVADKIRKGEF